MISRPGRFVCGGELKYGGSELKAPFIGLFTRFRRPCCVCLYVCVCVCVRVCVCVCVCVLVSKGFIHKATKDYAECRPLVIFYLCTVHLYPIMHLDLKVGGLCTLTFIRNVTTLFRNTYFIHVFP